MNTPTPRRPPPALLLSVALAGLLLSSAALGWLAWQFSMLPAILADFIRFCIFLVLPGYALALVWQRWGRTQFVHRHYDVLEARVQPSAPALTNDAPRLAAPPIAVVKSLEDGLDWIDQQSHALFGGRTKAGKTTLATALLERRLREGAPVFIIDPHCSGWMGLPTAGSIANPGELERALGAVLAEYMRRMQIREDYKRRTGQELPHNHWPRMTILIDEANAICDLLPVQWKTIMKQLASGSRKIGLSLLVLGQSALVEDLGMTGQMRANLARVALDDYAAHAMIDTERDKGRRDALRAELVGNEYPATAMIGSQVWAFDRRGLEAGSAPDGARALVWDGWDFDRGAAAAPVSAPPTSVQSIVGTPPDLPATVGGVKLSWIIAHMVARGQSHAEIAKVVASLAARVDTATPRETLQAAVIMRAEAITRSGNAALIAAQLDRDALIKACDQVGAGTRIAYTIWGGNSNAFYARARELTTA